MENLLTLFGVIAAISGAGGLCFVMVAVGAAVAKRIERGGRDPELLAEVDALRAEVEELGRLAERVPELEERVQFAERLLLNAPAAEPVDERTPV